MKCFFLLFFAVIFSASLNAQAPQNALDDTAQVSIVPKMIEWMTWDQAVARMEKEPRKILVDVYTNWCGWCKKMDASTMKDPTIAELMSDSWYAVKMNGEHKEDITFKGRIYKYVANGRKGYHELAAELMNGKMSYPTLIFLDENYSIIQPLPGYRKAPELEKILAYFGGDFYKNTSWEEFQIKYDNPN